MAIPAALKKSLPLVIMAVLIGILAVSLSRSRPAFRYAGTIEATKVDVPARVTSVISALEVCEGDRVETGQSLLKMACEDYRLNAQLAGDNYARAEQLFREGSLSRQDYDLVQNRKEDANLKASWCDVKSPLRGTVLTRYHEKGEMVTPGTRLFTLADLQDIYAYIYVPQPAVASLHLQQKITGTLPEMRGRTFAGTITWIAEEAEFTPKNVQTEAERTRLVYAVKIAFDNADETLKPGMTIGVVLPSLK